LAQNRPENCSTSTGYALDAVRIYRHTSSMKPGTPTPALRSIRLLDQLRERIRYLHYSLQTEGGVPVLGAFSFAGMAVQGID